MEARNRDDESQTARGRSRSRSAARTRNGDGGVQSRRKRSASISSSRSRERQRQKKKKSKSSKKSKKKRSRSKSTSSSSSDSSSSSSSASRDRKKRSKRRKKSSSKRSRDKQRSTSDVEHQLPPVNAQTVHATEQYDEAEPSPPAVAEDAQQSEDQQQLPKPKASKTSFFAQLAAEEAKKGPVGTIHAEAKTVYATSKTLKVAQTSDKWECPKCGKEQNKNNVTCESCGGLKRLSTWR
ncbi:hypothetical protein JKP88DRAFT_224684 [Tribonema minus]|uniref:RanBP2-type domain-containing protein n=1 Tax=Tribonema minus TaxID=303371 RepID=A0A835YS75_9STRA|nr:hypothetical protein JKP88DRAFT_224684 [Tribonema minus]